MPEHVQAALSSMKLTRERTIPPRASPRPRCKRESSSCGPGTSRRRWSYWLGPWACSSTRRWCPRTSACWPSRGRLRRKRGPGAKPPMPELRRPRCPLRHGELDWIETRDPAWWVTHGSRRSWTLSIHGPTAGASSGKRCVGGFPPRSASYSGAN